MAVSTRVLVCEWQPLVRAGLVAVLDRHADISVVASTASADQALEAVRTRHPTLALIGHDPPGFDGIELAATLAEANGHHVHTTVLLEESSIRGAAVRALRAGVRGVLRRDGEPDQLASAVREVSAGALVVQAPAVDEILASLLAQPELVEPAPPPIPAAYESLSGREIEVLRLVTRGLQNQEIAETLFVSIATVKSHVYRICRKLGLRDRVQLAILGTRIGLLTDPAEPGDDHRRPPADRAGPRGRPRGR